MVHHLGLHEPLPGACAWVALCAAQKSAAARRSFDVTHARTVFLPTPSPDAPKTHITHTTPQVRYVREFVRHGREGLLATSDRDMADQLIRLGRDRALRDTMAAHNRLVPPSMDWDDVVEANVAVYRRAIDLVAAN